MSEWSVAEPRRLTFDEPVTALHVRVVNGTVNVVGTDEGSARLEVSALEGPPLTVTQKDGTLTVAYDDLPWKGFLKWLDRKGRRRSALVSLAVPASTHVEVGVLGATAVVSGVEGRTEVKGVSGDTTLVGLTGQVRATTVSGTVEAQALKGDLQLSSVSGDLTVIDGSCPTVKADSVTGSIVLDLDPSGPTDVGLTSVSGEIAIRLPHPTDTEVEANTAGGTISNAFDDLRVSGPWYAHKVTGRLGSGNGRLRATTVSGSIALLRRPPQENGPRGDEVWGREPSGAEPLGGEPLDWDKEPLEEEPEKPGRGETGPSGGGARSDDASVGSGPGSGESVREGREGGDGALIGSGPGLGEAVWEESGGTAADSNPASGEATWEGSDDTSADSGPGPGEAARERSGPGVGVGASERPGAASAVDATDASAGTPRTIRAAAVTDNSTVGFPEPSEEPPGHTAAEGPGGAAPDESATCPASRTTPTTDKKVP